MYFAVWASSSDSSGFVEVMAPGLDRLDPAFEFVHVCIHCMPPRLRPVGTVSMIDTMILESHVLHREAPIFNAISLQRRRVSCHSARAGRHSGLSHLELVRGS
jgi:hypothetical protein